MSGFRFGNEQARWPRVLFPAETARHSLRDNLGRLRGQALWRAGPVEVSVKHSAWATAALAVSATVVIAACGSSNSSAPSAGGHLVERAGRVRLQPRPGPPASPRLHGHRHRRHRRQVVQRLGVGWHAGGREGEQQRHRQVLAVDDARPTTCRTSIRSSARSAKSSSPSGSLMGDATKAAAKAHPSQKFAIVDYAYTPPLSNVNALVFNTAQDAFQGGYLAAGMTKTGKVATFGGQKLPTVTIYMDGFWDGVQYYNQKHGKNVQVLGWNEKTQNGSFTGDFTNQTKGQTLTQTFISEGADIIFPVAGNVGPRRRQGGPAGGRRGRQPEGQHGCGSTSTDASARRSTASTSSPACRRAIVRGGEAPRCGHGQRLVQGRQLHRHAGQRRRRAGPVPRLGQQGAGRAEERAGADQGRASRTARSR